ncbi:Peptide chain release factor 1-like, mitochondrial, partial [Fragariocoptes setiger]
MFIKITHPVMLKVAYFVGHQRSFTTTLARFKRFYSSSDAAHTDQELIMDISNGVGGSEAMLFAREMTDVYLKYIALKRWITKIDDQDLSSLGGTRHTRLIVKGPSCLNYLIHEAGVHRVQRVPKTEKSGRIHTSTITVAVVPNLKSHIQLDDRDIVMETKRSSGPGGQHVNKIESAVRLIHKPTGVIVECQESRSQIDNRKVARQRLHKKLQEIEIDRILSRVTSLRQEQVGHADRNEKIRTYNFPQDRITDHRVGKNYHNLRSLIFDHNVNVLDKIINDLKSSK